MNDLSAEVQWSGDERGRSLLQKLSNGTLKGVAIVGARAADHTGLKWATEISASAVKHGYLVISGGARGVDERAHLEAVCSGGESVAILGSGLGHIQSRHRRLAEGGVGLLSPFSSTQTARRWTFPKRNELIAELADQVVVVQASLKSGALQTARIALRSQKPVWVVTHLPDHPLHLGCLRLIREGAQVYSPAETWSDNPQITSNGLSDPPCPRIPAQPSHPSLLWRASQVDPLPLEELAEVAGMPLSQALATATLLELDGWLIRAPNGHFLKGYGP